MTSSSAPSVESGRHDPLALPRPTAFNLRWEALWLRLLPHLARNYAWAPVDGFRMFGATPHQRYLSGLRRGRVEPLTARLFREHVAPGATVVDVGAYLGFYTLVGAREAGPTGMVYAFECDPGNYRFLLHNIRLNHFQETIVVSAAALSDENTSMPFFVRSWDLSGGSLWQQTGIKSVVEVASTTLDAALGAQRVDVLKMDIEGGELHALAGMEATIAASPSLVMFVECSPYALASSGGSAARLIERLRELGFQVDEIDDKQRVCRPVSEQLLAAESRADPKYYANLYCRRA